MSSTEETQAVAESFSRRGTPHGRLLVRVALATIFQVELAYSGPASSADTAPEALLVMLVGSDL